MFPQIIDNTKKLWNFWDIFRCRVKILTNKEMKASINELKKLKDLHKGKRCFVVGNGPSLKKMDVSKLRDEYCFCCNGMVFSELYDEIQPQYYLMADPNFFNTEDGKKVLWDLERKDIKPVLFVPYWESGEWCKQVENGCKRSIYSYVVSGIIQDRNAFRCDVAKGISPAYTVTQTAVLLAAYMGFSEIYLLGCDGTGIIQNVEIWSGESYGNHHAPNTCLPCNDIDDVYSEMINTFEGYRNILIGYNNLSLMCDKMGIKLYNASGAGIVNFIPSKVFEEIFEK